MQQQATMDPVLIEQMLAEGDAQAKWIEPDQLLFYLGKECTHFVFVRTGCVRVELLSTSGHQLLLYRINNGQSCVMTTACLLGDDHYSAQAVTETRVELVLLPQKAFLAWLDRSSAFRQFVFAGFTERLADMLWRTTVLATHTLDQRLAAVIVARYESLSAAEPIELTHEAMAIEIGTAREVVSRRLAIFEKEGLVERQRGQLTILDIEQLRKRLNA